MDAAGPRREGLAGCGSLVRAYQPVRKDVRRQSGRIRHALAREIGRRCTPPFGQHGAAAARFRRAWRAGWSAHGGGDRRAAPAYGICLDRQRLEIRTARRSRRAAAGPPRCSRRSGKGRDPVAGTAGDRDIRLERLVLSIGERTGTEDRTEKAPVRLRDHSGSAPACRGGRSFTQAG